jgi:hypothetical protein
VIDKFATVIFFANVNTSKANSSQQMDYKVRSHDLGNLLHRYYYIKKVLQVVRLVINIRVQERVYSIFKNVHIILMQRDAWCKAWYVRGVSYAILMLRNSYSVGYLLPSLETFHSTTTEKSVCLFTDVAIHEVAWYVIKQKRWHNETAVLPSQVWYRWLQSYKLCFDLVIYLQ